VGINIAWSVTLVVAIAAAVVSWLAYRRSEHAKRRLQHLGNQQKRNPDDAFVLGADQLQALGKVVASIAHDVNSALSVVVMNLDVMQRDQALSDQHRRRIDNMIKAAQRGTSLLRYLLDLAHRNSEQPDVVQLSEIMPALIDLVQAALSKKVEVEPVIAPDLWNTRLSISEFEIAAIHLATKIGHAMPDMSRLTLELKNDVLDDAAARRTGEHVVVTLTGWDVREKGAAIGERKAIDTTQVILGLDVVDRIVRQAGGHVQIEVNPEGGVRVALYLPRCIETMTA
jgi:signal transduction histidine kinase